MEPVTPFDFDIKDMEVTEDKLISHDELQHWKLACQAEPLRLSEKSC